MINKQKNVSIQITFPKEYAEKLETLKRAFEKENINVSKSEILLQAFIDYLKILVACGAPEKKEEEPQGEVKDA